MIIAISEQIKEFPNKNYHKKTFPSIGNNYHRKIKNRQVAPKNN